MKNRVSMWIQKQQKRRNEVDEATLELKKQSKLMEKLKYIIATNAA